MTKKILCIDGGGIKGVFPASFLASIEATTGKKIVEHFDLIVGTSTGGIIALGLGMGFSANEILDFYEQSGSKIFQGNKYLNFVKGIFTSKYSNSNLKTALEEKFKDKKMGESITRLVIPSLNLENGEVHVYKTAHNERFKTDYKEKVVDIAMATSAAPTYFPTFNSSSGIPLVDGGIWANNPIGLSVVEAIGVLGWNREELKVLSLGCTTEALDIKLARKSPMGFLYWGKAIVELFMKAQSSSSLGTALLLAGRDNIIRISPNVSKKKFGLDTVGEISSMKGLGYSEARIALPQINFFFVSKVEPFDPINKL